MKPKILMFYIMKLLALIFYDYFLIIFGHFYNKNKLITKYKKNK